MAKLKPGLEELHALVLIARTETEAEAKIQMASLGKNNTFAIFLAATKSMAKLLTYELTYVGTAVNGLSFATGYSVANASRGPMNSKDTEERIQEKNDSCARNATRNS